MISPILLFKEKRYILLDSIRAYCVGAAASDIIDVEKSSLII
jgi:hypothetical protein